MIESDEKLFQLLLTEKALADTQIGGYGDLSLKVLGFFGGAAAVMGWAYSDKGLAYTSTHPVAVGVICLAVMVLGCGVILQGITTYGIALGYIQYKHETLNKAFVRVAGITRQYPFNHVKAWWKGAARPPVLLATLGFLVLHAAVSFTLIAISVIQFAQHRPWYLAASAFAIIALAFTFYVEYRLYVALQRVFQIHLPFPPSGDDDDISRAG
jgi:hypothetical protein